MRMYRFDSAFGWGYSLGERSLKGYTHTKREKLMK
jgi:hypothetical protein